MGISNPVEQITGEIRPNILQSIDANAFMVRPLDWVGGVVVLNADIANVPQDAVTHGVNYFMENLYFDR